MQVTTVGLTVARTVPVPPATPPIPNVALGLIKLGLFPYFIAKAKSAPKTSIVDVQDVSVSYGPGSVNYVMGAQGAGTLPLSVLAFVFVPPCCHAAIALNTIVRVACCSVAMMMCVCRQNHTPACACGHAARIEDLYHHG
ncbi:MAG: hypothetical protein EOO65_02750 [Methanosarcinales archaeon]|nr:MAG: hypothetical protein EOO65_02750 [Methanosarcinales archaeon]